MASVVVYDAKVLYDNTLRDMMIRVARSRLVQEKWSDRILREALKSRTEHCHPLGNPTSTWLHWRDR